MKVKTLRLVECRVANSLSTLTHQFGVARLANTALSGTLFRDC
jgi:hypothetical protein